MQTLKIHGMSVVGEGEAERMLQPFLQQMFRLCDRVFVCLNRTDEKTRKMVKESGAYVLEDDREWGRFQHRIKEDFLKKVVSLDKPDWIVWLDCDEFFEKRVTRETLEYLASQRYDVAYFFWFLELWDSEEYYREDYTFEDVRFFKVIPEEGFHFKQTPLHCGVYPEKVASWGTHTPYIVYHYGLLREEDRRRKYERYKTYDPKALYLPKEWYEGLLSKNPPLKKISEFSFPRNMKFNFKERPMPSAKKDKGPKKLWTFINPHGVVITFDNEDHYLQRINDKRWKFIEERVLEEENTLIESILEQGPSDHVVEDLLSLEEAKQEAEKNELPGGFVCSCGYKTDKKKAIAMHKRRKKHD